MDIPTIKITVKKHTGEDLVRLAAGFTSGHESKITLRKAYRTEHSIIRTQVFSIELYNIPLFVSTHLLRHHVGSQPFQLTCREDRNGGNPCLKERVARVNGLVADGRCDEAYRELDWIAENTDRYTKVNLLLFLNAQALIDMAKLRLCNKASGETRRIFAAIRLKVAAVDPDLAVFMVPKCIYRGGICCEPGCCGYNLTNQFRQQLADYVREFGLSESACYSTREELLASL